MRLLGENTLPRVNGKEAVGAMDMVQVQMALSVARNKSFSAAAKELAYSQSTVSKRINAFELELGVRLFERKARAQVELTREGEQLLADLQAIERDAETLMSRAAQLKEHQGKRLRLGCLSGWSTFGEDEIIVAFNEHMKASSIEQVVGTRPYLTELMTTRRIDGLFLAIAEPKEILSLPEGFATQDVWDLRLKVACSANHPAAGKETVSLLDFKDDMFIFRKNRAERESDVKLNCFIEACESEGFSPEIEYADLRSSMAFSMVSAGLCVMPLMFKPKTLRSDMRLIPVDKDYYHFRVKFVYRADDDNELLREFVSFLKGYRRSFGKDVRDE